LLIIGPGMASFNEQFQVTAGPASGFVLIKLTADGSALSDGRKAPSNRRGFCRPLRCLLRRL
jgi:hypothetical protein